MAVWMIGIGELNAEHGAVLVNAVLEAVELRLLEERRTVAALRAIPPAPRCSPSGHCAERQCRDRLCAFAMTRPAPSST
jgi:hypothetical protein